MKVSSIVFLTVFIASFTVLAETEELDFEGAVKETYKTASGDDLKIHIFSPEGHDPAADERPAIVFFFGGGWSGGSPGQFEQHCRYLASRGMVAMCADYRVKSRQGTDPFACAADGKSAIRWVRANAERLGVDPEMIAAGGGSAGGHVAATTGIISGLDEEGENHSVSSRADALVLFNPVYDNGPEGYGNSRVVERWKEISPAHNISKDDPPTIVFLGSKDSLIPVATAEKFEADLDRVGVENELYVYEGQAHGFFNEAKGGKENFLDTLAKMDAFLVKMGFLDGEGSDEQRRSVLRKK
jgi:acetyl esterase